MSTTPVTPTAGNASVVTVGGTPVTAIVGGPNGGIISNPLTETDQGISPIEAIYVDPVNPAALIGNGTTFSIQPGQTWSVIPGQTTVTSVNAATSGHKFSVVNW